MAGQTEVAEPTGTSGTVVVRAGRTVILKAGGKPEKWEKDGQDLHIPRMISADLVELTFVMDRKGAAAGGYRWVEAGGTAGAPVQVRLTRPSLSALQSGLTGGVALVVTLYALAVTWLLSPVEASYPTAGDILNGSSGQTFRAYAFATVTLALTVLVLQVVTRAYGGVGGLFRGTDRRTSTSKTQYLLWTFGIAYVLAYIGARSIVSSGRYGQFVCAGGDAHNCVQPDSWPSFLVLLGVPAAAAVVTKGVTVRKIQDGTLQKTTGTETGGGTLLQVAADDNGSADIADVQYLVFNILAFVFVVVTFVRYGVLDDVPPILLGLTSASAATYVLNKGLQSNVPAVRSVVPGVVRPDDRLLVSGTNLFPPGEGDTWHERAVKVGGVPAEVLVRDRTAGTLTVRAPSAGMATTASAVTVVTAAGLETEPRPVVLELDLVVLGGHLAALPKDTGGGTLDLLTAGLSNDTDLSSVTLLVDGQPAGPVERTGPSGLHVVLSAQVLPPGARAKDMTVLLRQGGRSSTPHSFSAV